MKRRIKKGDSMEASYKHSYKTGENLLNSLSVYNVGYQKCDPEYQWGPGVRDHYCIHHILSGSGCYCTGTVSKHLEEGDTFILYPGVELRYQADADKRLVEHFYRLLSGYGVAVSRLRNHWISKMEMDILTIYCTLRQNVR